MQQVMTVLRIASVILLGIVLFKSLICLFSGCERRYLKKRKKSPSIAPDRLFDKIFLFYLVMLIICVLIMFLINKYLIRGVS